MCFVFPLEITAERSISWNLLVNGKITTDDVDVTVSPEVETFPETPFGIGLGFGAVAGHAEFTFKGDATFTQMDAAVESGMTWKFGMQFEKVVEGSVLMTSVEEGGSAGFTIDVKNGKLRFTFGTTIETWTAETLITSLPTGKWGDWQLGWIGTGGLVIKVDGKIIAKQTKARHRLEAVMEGLGKVIVGGKLPDVPRSTFKMTSLTVDNTAIISMELFIQSFQ